MKRKSHASFTGFLDSHIVRSVQKYEVHSTFVSTVPDICEKETRQGLGVQGGIDRNKWPFRPQNAMDCEDWRLRVPRIRVWLARCHMLWRRGTCCHAGHMCAEMPSGALSHLARIGHCARIPTPEAHA